jgi:hypothetical protein
MKIDWALLAKAAMGYQGAAPSILGAGLNAINVIPREMLPAAGLPKDAICGPASFAVVMGLLAQRSEIGLAPHIRVTVTDLDGTERFRMEVNAQIGAAPPDLPAGSEIPMHFVMELTFMPAKYETHSVNVFVDNSLQRTMLVNVRPIHQPHM